MMKINKIEGSSRIVNSDGVSSGEGVKVQTEKGELVITSSGEIANVAANKLHSEMEEDEITDVLEVGSYVLSNATDGSMNITKEEAEGISLGMGMSVFDELGKSTAGFEKTLADFFPKGVEEMTPADLGRRIRSKYPLNNRTDEYSKATNVENKKNREKALMELVSLNESKRPKEEDIIMSNETNSGMDSFKFGGDVLQMNTGGSPGNPLERQVSVPTGMDDSMFMTYGNVSTTDDGKIGELLQFLSGYTPTEPTPAEAQGQSMQQIPMITPKPLSTSAPLIDPVYQRGSNQESPEQMNNNDGVDYRTEIEKKFDGERAIINEKLDEVRNDFNKILEQSNKEARDSVNSDLQKYIENVTKAYRVYNRQSTVGLLANMAVNAVQDPRVDTVDLSDQINAAKSELDRTPEYLKEYQSKGLSAQSRNNARIMFENTSQFNRAASNMAGVNANIAKALSDIAVANNQQEIGQFNQRLKTIGELRTKQDMYDVDQANKERANLNAKISAYGNSIENYLGELKMSGLTRSNAINTANYQASNALKELRARSDFYDLRQNQANQLALNQQTLNKDAEQARAENRINPETAEYSAPNQDYGQFGYKGEVETMYDADGMINPGRSYTTYEYNKRNQAANAEENTTNNNGEPSVLFEVYKDLGKDNAERMDYLAKDYPSLFGDNSISLFGNN